ncbi:MAG: hypothetical protein JXX14_16815, partial [Deltaproteobacteria bacterium]|nr:hypothetical protein [Deltaproteobacteria bacterium]
MRLHFIISSVVKTVGVCIIILSFGCRNENSEVYTVSPRTIETYEDTVIEICGEGIQPLVKRNMGCGESTLETRENFRVDVRKIFNRTDDRWIRLPDVRWNWQTQCLEAHLSRQFITARLTRDMHSMRVYTPDGSMYPQRYAFGVLMPRGENTDTASDTESANNSLDSGNPEDSSTPSDTQSVPVDTDTILVDTNMSTAAPMHRNTIAWKPTNAIQIDGKFTDWPTSDGIALPNSIHRIILQKENSPLNAPPDVETDPFCTFEQMWDSKNLYIGIRCNDASLQTATRNTLTRGDSIEIYLDAESLQADKRIAWPIQIRIAYTGGNQATVPWDSTVPLPGLRFQQTDIGISNAA